jgi:hypothetical protein
LKLLLAANVPLCRLHRSVAEQKLNLFQLSSASVAKAGAAAPQIVGCQILYADTLCTALNGIPDNIRSYARISDRPILQKLPEDFAVDYT